MQNMLSKKDVNSTVAIVSPLDGTDVLVRTGVPSGPDNILHAALHAASKEYLLADEKKRGKLVSELREKLRHELLAQKWAASKTRKSMISEAAQKVIKDFYKSVLDNRECKLKETKKVLAAVVQNDTDQELYKVLCEFVPISEWENILGKDNQNPSFKDLKEYEKHVQAKYEALLKNLRQEAENTSFKVFCESTKIPSPGLSDLSAIADTICRNIFVIDSESRLPRLSSEKKERNCILLLDLAGHLEVMGRLLPGQRIQRDFEYTAPLIKRVYAKLEERPVKPLRPTEKKSRSTSESASESDRESGSESDRESASESDREESSEPTPEKSRRQSKHRKSKRQPRH